MPDPAADSVRLPDGLLMTSAGRSPARTVWNPVTVWLPSPSMRRDVLLEVVKVDITVTSPRASSVPVFTAPLARLRVPREISVSPAAIVFVPDRNERLFRVRLVTTSIAALFVEKATVPLLCANEPPEMVKPFWTVRIPLVLVNDPALWVKTPFVIVIARSPPTKVPAPWMNPAVPTLKVRPIACVIVPVYPALIAMPCTETLASIETLPVLVASNWAVSAAPGRTSPDQLAALDHSPLPAPPSHVRTAPRTREGQAAPRMTATTRSAGTLNRASLNIARPGRGLTVPGYPGLRMDGTPPGRLPPLDTDLLHLRLASGTTQRLSEYHQTAPNGTMGRSAVRPSTRRGSDSGKT